MQKQGVFNRGLVEKAANIQNTFAGKLYQGSDDIWKIYSYEMELGRLMDAFKKGARNIPVTDVENLLMLRRSNKSVADLTGDDLQKFLKREAASIVKDTVPNYVRVPEAIQAQEGCQLVTSSLSQLRLLEPVGLYTEEQ